MVVDSEPVDRQRSAQAPVIETPHVSPSMETLEVTVADLLAIGKDLVVSHGD